MSAAGGTANRSGARVQPGGRSRRAPGTRMSGPRQDGAGSVPPERFAVPPAVAPDPPGPHAVRVGLSRVFGLTRATGERILAARVWRAFTSLADLADRARPTLPEMEALILAGALDWTGHSRPLLLLEARVGARVTGALPLRAGARDALEMPALVTADGLAFKPEAVTPVATARLPEFGPAERVRGEAERAGCGSRHTRSTCWSIRPRSRARSRRLRSPPMRDVVSRWWACRARCVASRPGTVG